MFLSLLKTIVTMTDLSSTPLPNGERFRVRTVVPPLFPAHGGMARAGMASETPVFRVFSLNRQKNGFYRLFDQFWDFNIKY